MTLSDRARFARQVLVPEIGDEGQARLCAATFTVASLGPEAAAIARLYLRRAGLEEAEAPGPVGAAGSPADEALAGALHAVEAIKRALNEPEAEP